MLLLFLLPFIERLLPQAIRELEASMNSSFAAIDVLLPDVYEKSKFNKEDLFVILQGIAGFLSAVKGKDPLAATNEVVGVIGHFTTKCNTGTLQSIKGKISKWVTFGKKYEALKDSNDLDFDQMDVTAVPEMMKVIDHFLGNTTSWGNRD